MQMERFRVENYKKIKDSGWIDCGDITTFVGKNESGKSALFRGLSKMKPSDGELYDGLVEFPRSRYSDEFKQKDWPVSSVKFRLEGNEQKYLKQIWSKLSKVSHVVITRHYSNRYTINLKPSFDVTATFPSDYIHFLTSVKSKITTLSEEHNGLASIVDDTKNTLDQIIEEVNAQGTSELLNEEIPQRVSESLSVGLGGSAEEQFRALLDKNSSFFKSISLRKKIDEAEDWILENMPEFIYFDRYNVIESAIHIGKFRRDIRDAPDDKRLRTTKCLFEHVGLSIDEIHNLNPAGEDPSEDLERMFRERHIQVSSASASMTKKFSKWWDQRKYVFRYDVDGHFFRVWVSDDLDPSEIELDQRSAGMQYFFSFYLIFLVESARGHKNSILLLDEPGLHYHGTAQKKAVEFLQKIARDNHVLYTTHSPFMIDGNRLDDVRIVHEDKQTGHTIVSSDTWPTDPDALFPLQAGLGYTLAQTLFYANNNLIVEGITDYLILTTMNEFLKQKSMTALNDDVVIVPVGGVSKIMPLASLLVANNLKLVVLLDGDKPGLNKARQLKNERIVDHIVLVSDFTDSDVAELEDLFPTDFYMSAVREAYPDYKIEFNDAEIAIPYATKRISAAFKRQRYGEFAKWDVADVLVARIRKGSGGYDISKSCKRFEQLFDSINQKFRQK